MPCFSARGRWIVPAVRLKPVKLPRLLEKMASLLARRAR
jgi:hypothetical protein